MVNSEIARPKAWRLFIIQLFKVS